MVVAVKKVTLPPLIVNCALSCERLWAAMALIEVFDGRKKIADVASKYDVSIGDIESLIQSTSPFLVRFKDFAVK